MAAVAGPTEGGVIVLWLPAATTEARERELLEVRRVDEVRRSVWVTSPVWSQEG